MKTVIRNSYTPQIGDYCETVVVDRESGFKYLFDCDGVYTRSSIGEIIEDLDGYREAHEDTDVFSTGGTLDAIDYYVGEEAAAREAADEEIEQEIEDLRNNTDVVDIVGTYAELEDYDTSKLGDNDIIKVLQDETRDNATTYYKWHKTTEVWEYIGEQGPFYTQDQTDDLLDEKQDVLTAGDNITIDADNVISATVPEVDSALSFTSTNAVENQAIKNAIYAKRSGNYNQEAGVDIKYDDPYSSPYVAIGGVATGGRGSASVGIGYNSSAAGLGSVAIGDGAATTDREQVAIGMLAKSGPYSTVVGARSRADTSTGSYNVLVGPSSRIDGGSGSAVLIGRSVSVSNGASESVAIGYDSSIGTAAAGGVAIGKGAEVANSAVSGIAIGVNTAANHQGSVAIGSGSTTSAGMTVSVGNSDTKRRITWLADGINGFDAVNKSQLDTAIAGVTVPVMTGATASTAGAQGSAPAPAAGDQDKFLKGDGTWATATPTTDAALSFSSTNPIQNQAITNTLFAEGTGADAGKKAGVNIELNSADIPAQGYPYVYIGSQNTLSRATGAVGIGFRNEAAATQSVAIGPWATVAGRSESAIAIGDTAEVDDWGERSIAIGNNAYVEDNCTDSVALGSNSEANGSDIISVGNEAENYYRGIKNVEDGWEDHDAVNYKQLTAATAVMTGATTSTNGKKGLVPAPTQYDTMKILKGDGTWGEPMVILSYGFSTWQDFIRAYSENEVVYCRASSNADPSVGAQGRMAFMAYVNNATSPTEVEFQYVRSVGSKTASQPVDQVFVYKLTSANGGTWTVATRDMAPKLAAGTNTTVSYSNGTYTISATQPTVPTVVQTTGQSTTDVMSQKAVTDIIGNIETILQTLNSGNGAQ